MKMWIEGDSHGKLRPKSVTTNALQIIPFEEPGKRLAPFQKLRNRQPRKKLRGTAVEEFNRVARQIRIVMAQGIDEPLRSARKQFVVRIQPDAERGRDRFESRLAGATEASVVRWAHDLHAVSSDRTRAGNGVVH